MVKKDKTIKQMTLEVAESFDSYIAQGTKKWGWQSAVKDLPYQIGSLTKIMQQLTNERWAEGKSKKQLKEELSDELADVIACVLFIAEELNINIEEAWEKMLESDKQKISARSR